MKNAIVCIVGLFMVLVAGCASQKQEWENANQVNTIESYQEFVRQYPKSQYVGQAREKTEDLFWQQRQAKDTTEAYQEYIQQYTKGKYASIARERSDELFWKQKVAEDSISGYLDYLRKYKRRSQEALAKIKSLLSHNLLSDEEGQTLLKRAKTFCEPFNMDELIIEVQEEIKALQPGQATLYTTSSDSDNGIKTSRLIMSPPDDATSVIELFTQIKEVSQSPPHTVGVIMRKGKEDNRRVQEDIVVIQSETADLKNGAKGIKGKLVISLEMGVMHVDFVGNEGDTESYLRIDDQWYQKPE